MLREAKFCASEVELNMATGPENGPPLLLLHGVVRSWQDFLPIVPALTTRWQLYALDHRGHGSSGRVPGAYGVADYVRDSVAVVRGVMAEPAVIYGHSLGAMVALGVAAVIPDRVRAIVLEDPPCSTLGARIKQTAYPELYTAWHELLQKSMPVPELARALADLVLTTPEGKRVRLGDIRDATSLRFTAKCLSRMDPDVLKPIIAGRWYESYELDTILPRVRCPTLLLQADAAAGGMLSDEDADQIIEGTPDTIRIRFPNVGHLLHWQATEATLRHVQGFLESV